jgi:ubiquitin-like protein 5
VTHSSIVTGVSLSPKDTIGDFKKLVAAQIGTEGRKIVLKKWHKEFRDHITLDDYELNMAYVYNIFFFDSFIL